MRKIRKTPGPSTRLGRRTTWIGGVIDIADPRGPERPVVALVLTEDGFVRGSALQPPGFVDEAIAAAVAQSLTRPKAGEPGAPAKLTVATPELAAAFARHLPTTEVFVGPTPEIDEVAYAMLQRTLDGDNPLRRGQEG
ncbi:MAG: hypothetical protein Q8O67_11015 [Deltaproteobacteria bacterium]|nr:hypothetical protein [Deltaproteobacteria bacterium]